MLICDHFRWPRVTFFPSLFCLGNSSIYGVLPFSYAFEQELFCFDFCKRENLLKLNDIIQGNIHCRMFKFYDISVTLIS